MWGGGGGHHGHHHHQPGEDLMMDCLCCPCTFLCYAIYVIEQVFTSCWASPNWFGGGGNYYRPDYGPPGYGASPGYGHQGPPFWPNYGTLQGSSSGALPGYGPPLPPHGFTGSSSYYIPGGCCSCHVNRCNCCRTSDPCSVNYSSTC